MRVYANQLQTQLSRGLKPVYLVFGDEPLQKIEAIDAIRLVAKQAGFIERQSFTVDSSFNWDELFAAFSELSLFASQKIIELHIDNGKPGQQGSKALVECIGQFNPDTILLIHGGKLEASSTKAKWFKALDGQGLYIPTYPIDASKMPRWVSDRARNNKVMLDNSAIQLLSDYYAGNLLACSQELEKLAISYPNQHISGEFLQSVVLNQSRYSVFQLVDELLAGKIAQAINILVSLQQESIEPTIVNWALAREAILLFEMKTLINCGQAVNDVLKQHKIWSSKQGLYQSALNRLSLKQLELIVTNVQHIDKKLKTTSPIQPFADFSHVCMCFDTKMAKTMQAMPLSDR